MLTYSYCFCLKHEHNELIKVILDTFTISMDENYITKHLLEYQLVKRVLFDDKINKIVKIPSINKHIQKNYLLDTLREGNKLYEKEDEGDSLENFLDRLANMNLNDSMNLKVIENYIRS